jgi:DNA-binding MarR family transcriptional regulator
MNNKITSKIAYKRILGTLSRGQRRVFLIITRFPGSTIKDVAKKLKTDPHKISGRFSEMERSGRIKTDGFKYYKEESQPHNKYFVKL